jgi:hypothetical protein
MYWVVFDGMASPSATANARQSNAPIQVVDERPGARIEHRSRLAKAHPRLRRRHGVLVDIAARAIVIDILRRPELLTEKLEAHRATLGAREVEIRSRLDHLARELCTVERQEARLVDDYAEEQFTRPPFK